jgi:hypothetical protein
MVMPAACHGRAQSVIDSNLFGHLENHVPILPAQPGDIAPARSRPFLAIVQTLTFRCRRLKR